MFNITKKIFLFPGMEQLNMQFYQTAEIGTEFDNVVYVCDSKLAAIKMITTISHTSYFLNAIEKVSKVFSVHEKHGQ